VGVFVSNVSPKGHTFLDRRLYLPDPESIEDQTRRQEAGVPQEVGFQTKAELARSMLEHAWEVGVPGRWVTGDEVYGGDRNLRIWLEIQKRPYVLGVRSNEKPWAHTPRGPAQLYVSKLAAQVPAKAWKRLSAGDGAKGRRLYDWAWIPLIAPIEPDWGRWLLVRRSLEDPTELAYYLVYAPRQTTQRQAVHVAGSRWTVE
jgi:SRSO17 transposase